MDLMVLYVFIPLLCRQNKQLKRLKISFSDAQPRQTFTDFSKNKRIQSVKIILVHPKYKIDLLITVCKLFQYCNSNQKIMQRRLREITIWVTKKHPILHWQNCQFYSTKIILQLCRVQKYYFHPLYL